MFPSTSMTFSFKIWIFEAVFFFHCCPTPPSNKKHGNHEKFGPPGKGRNSSDLTKNPSFSDSIIINLRRRSSSQLTRGFKKNPKEFTTSPGGTTPMGMAFRIGLHTTRAPSGHVSHTWKETEKPSWWVVSESPTWQHDSHRVGMYKTPCNSWGYETHINSWTLDFWTINCVCSTKRHFRWLWGYQSWPWRNAKDTLICCFSFSSPFPSGKSKIDSVWIFIY